MSSKGDINTQISLFLTQLKRRQISGAKEVALATANLLIRFISSRRWVSTTAMIEQIRILGAKLVDAQPYELTCGNVIKRVLKNIRTINEAFAPKGNKDTDLEEDLNPSSSMLGLLSVSDSMNTSGDGDSSNNSSMANLTKHKSNEAEPGLTPSGYYVSEEVRAKARDLRNAVIDEIQSLIDEIQNDDPLFKAGIDMITDSDLLLTPCPSSKTMVDFLLKAAAKRNFTVIVTESYPNNVEKAKKMVQQLKNAGVKSTLIPDAAVFAVMAKVSKVVISARAVLANGGCIASSGVAMACHAAKQFTKPVLSIAGSYKLSPIYPFDVESLIEVGNSSKVIDFSDAELMDKLEVINPLYDYISPELIDIVISSDGGASPNFVYRLILDNYSEHDQHLSSVEIGAA
ncbi:translation initiation factor eIF2B subunit beta [Starmerella bacillaris]|uniref:Translation initiation factor eIF2B subunit beta n=1 Tax=Starmerella bacillaris TaxID=1247836 RepID=A0AAV5RJY0_STABA|nr:translation initiation factor eIF2B subunit beta [Starmerella bacillaris]